MIRSTNYPSQEVKEFGERLSEHLSTASIQNSMGGLGGCKIFDINNFPEEFRQYIQAYLCGNHDSIALIYTATRDKEQSLNQ